MAKQKKSVKMADRPLCRCHNEPMRWSPDRRRRTGGYWKCKVQNVERMRKKYQTDSEYRANTLARKRERYASYEWIKKRQRDLNKQRIKAEERLAQIQTEIY